MLKITAKNEGLLKILKICHPEFIKAFLNFVEQNPILQMHQFKAKGFTFQYSFLVEKNLVVIRSFKQQKDGLLNYGQTIEERRTINQLYNDYLDNDKSINF